MHWKIFGDTSSAYNAHLLVGADVVYDFGTLHGGDAFLLRRMFILLSDAETKAVLIISILCCLDNKLATNI